MEGQRNFITDRESIFLRRYNPWWHFPRITSALEENPRLASKTVSMYLNSFLISTDDPWIGLKRAIVSLLEKVTTISLVLLCSSSWEKLVNGAGWGQTGELCHQQTSPGDNWIEWTCISSVLKMKSRGVSKQPSGEPVEI